MTGQAASKLRLTVLYDNHAADPSLRTDWGFSCAIEGLDKRILFDTGRRPAILRHNMERLGIDPIQIEAVVLSHVDHDHTGGLPFLLERRSPFTLVVPRSFSTETKAGMHEASSSVIEVDRPVRIFPSAYSTGELGSKIIEQSLILEASEGTIIITGCAHPGVASVVERAREILPDEPIQLLIGGFHMFRMRKRKITRVISRLQELGVMRIAPSHCSGNRARHLFAEAFGDRYVSVGAGSVLTFDRTLADA